ncbi:hypothetical protein [Bartonella sp. F02]|uniref:hypothetical protein n=1 Tax=Bartonella sp. F02 TaxID=2967262 RepID=UPI0022A993DE|nr:hypothetical protein [Bartonella sp. F02]MCZ2328702.1 hypothetical protein [Bartonella sp. F02]
MNFDYLTSLLCNKFPSTSAILILLIVGYKYRKQWISFLYNFINKDDDRIRNFTCFFKYLAISYPEIFIWVIHSVLFYPKANGKNYLFLKKMVLKVAKEVGKQDDADGLSSYFIYLADKHPVVYFYLLDKHFFQYHEAKHDLFFKECFLKAAQKIGSKYSEFDEDPFVAYLIYFAKKNYEPFTDTFHRVFFLQKNESPVMDFLQKKFEKAACEVNNTNDLRSYLVNIAKENPEKFIDLLFNACSHKGLLHSAAEEIGKNFLQDVFFEKYAPILPYWSIAEDNDDNNHLVPYLIYLEHNKPKKFIELFNKNKTKSNSFFEKLFIDAVQKIGREYGKKDLFFYISFIITSNSKKCFDEIIKALENKENNDSFKNKLIDIVKTNFKNVDDKFTENFDDCYYLLEQFSNFLEEQEDILPINCLSFVEAIEKERGRDGISPYFQRLLIKTQQTFANFLIDLFSCEKIERYKNDENFLHFKQAIIQVTNKIGTQHIDNYSIKETQDTKAKYNKDSFVPYLIYLAHKHYSIYFSLFEQVLAPQNGAEYDESLKNALVEAANEVGQYLKKRENADSEGDCVSYFVHHLKGDSQNLKGDSQQFFEFLTTTYSLQEIKHTKMNRICSLRTAVIQQITKAKTQYDKDSFVSHLVSEEKKNSFYFSELFSKVFSRIFNHLGTENEYNCFLKKSLLETIEKIGKEHDPNTKNGSVSYLANKIEKDPEYFVRILNYQDTGSKYDRLLKKSLLEAIEKIGKKYDPNTKNGCASYLRHYPHFMEIFFDTFFPSEAKIKYDRSLQKIVLQTISDMGEICYQYGLSVETFSSENPDSNTSAQVQLNVQIPFAPINIIRSDIDWK